MLFFVCVCFFIVNQEAIKQLYLPNQNIHEYILFSVCLFLTVNGKRCPQSMHRAQNAIYWQNWPWRSRRKRKKHQTHSWLLQSSILRKPRHQIHICANTSTLPIESSGTVPLTHPDVQLNIY